MHGLVSNHLERLTHTQGLNDWNEKVSSTPTTHVP